MIHKLYENIAAGLKNIKSCTVYQEDVPQDFMRPSFLITLYSQRPAAGINGRLKNNVGVDIQYFPEDTANGNAECWNTAETLKRELVVKDFKLKKQNMEIADKVLHYKFEVSYREYLEEDNTQMQAMTQANRIKEE